MVIVQATGWYFPESLGGTEVYVGALARRLKRRGHDVHVVAPDPAHREERRYEVEGVPVYRYPIPATPTRDQAQGRRGVPGIERLHAWLEKRRPAVFHSHSFVTGLGLEELKVAKRIGAAVVATCHTPGLGYLCPRGSMMRWGRELCDGRRVPRECASCSLEHRGMPVALAEAVSRVPVSLSEPLSFVPGRVGTTLGMAALQERNRARQSELLRTVDALVLLTEWARSATAAHAGSDAKLFLNRLGVDAERLQAETRGDRNGVGPVRFGYLGRFEAIKGVLDLAEAVSQLPRSLEFELELRGPTSDAASEAIVRRMKTRVGDDPRVRFGAAVPRDAVGATLRGYDALICPTACLEGGPTVAMEAHAVGTPVIGTRIGGLAEILEDGVSGRLVPPRDPAALAAAIEEIVREPVATLGRWKSRLPRSRSMDEIVEDYLRLYSRMGSGR